MQLSLLACPQLLCFCLLGSAESKNHLKRENEVLKNVFRSILHRLNYGANTSAFQIICNLSSSYRKLGHTVFLLYWFQGLCTILNQHAETYIVSVLFFAVGLPAIVEQCSFKCFLEPTMHLFFCCSQQPFYFCKLACWTLR